MFLSKRTLCDGEKSKYLKEKEATGLLRSLGKKIYLNKITLAGPILF